MPSSRRSAEGCRRSKLFAENLPLYGSLTKLCHFRLNISIPFQVSFNLMRKYPSQSGIIIDFMIDSVPDRVYNISMNTIAKFIKQKRKEAGLTQEEFAIRSGLGLRFVRELEQGKETVRMDKVNQALSMFGMKAVPGRKDEQ